MQSACLKINIEVWYLFGQEILISGPFLGVKL